MASARPTRGSSSKCALLRRKAHRLTLPVHVRRRSALTANRRPRVLVLARNYPNNAFPTLGVWTQRLVAASTRVARPTVVAPVPYAPPLMPLARYRRFRTVRRNHVD